eukprot:7951532-Alexandrium_andersonii.AAC.1
MCIRDRTPSIPAFIGGFGICANNGAERTPRELGGPILRPRLGPRSSRFERVKRFCMLQVLGLTAYARA